MGILEKFAEHFIAECPVLSIWLMGLIIVMIFLVSPVLIFVLFSEKYNKGRYLFEKKVLGEHQREHLYMLDTMKGKLYFVDGNHRYQRMYEYDWKEAREKGSSEKES